MPRFRFTAADSSGATHDGTIDAATADDARNKLASNGLAVRTVEEMATPESVVAPDLPRRATPKPESPFPDPTHARPRKSETPEPVQRRGGSPFPIIFSLLALLISLSTAAYTLTRDPLKGRLDKYDFSTPEKAYLSSVRMAADGDYLARFERESKLIGPQAREQFTSSQIENEPVRHDGKVGLFITYSRNGKVRRQVRWFELDPVTKMWKRAWVLETELVGNGNGLPPQIAAKIARFVTPPEPGEAFTPDVDW
ncbi:MAG: hypothetical protein K8U57_25810 [Planctomycetes bacterium]|nr:hypothetical protein [Planctomycetota bacterium]